mmetsp:Transcript_20230/g.52492  ORF Transcript_20230/g.52492 Transcript_20230/m.52492 type:complete len:214 (+) Transcript_20230:732-1373(+)
MSQRQNRTPSKPRRSKPTVATHQRLRRLLTKPQMPPKRWRTRKWQKRALLTRQKQRLVRTGRLLLRGRLRRTMGQQKVAPPTVLLQTLEQQVIKRKALPVGPPRPKKAILSPPPPTMCLAMLTAARKVLLMERKRWKRVVRHRTPPPLVETSQSMEPPRRTPVLKGAPTPAEMSQLRRVLSLQIQPWWTGARLPLRRALPLPTRLQLKRRVQR